MSDFEIPDKEGGQVFFDYVDDHIGQDFQAKIKAIGVGGAGGNAIRTMFEQGITGVEFAVLNTDSQALQASPVPMRLQLGKQRTKGLGAGGKPEVGRAAAQDASDDIRDLVTGSDMVFITAGMGGGTGTGAAAVVSAIAKEAGALTVGVVTKPFTFEGKKRMHNADQGLRELRKTVDTLITIPNQQLLGYIEKKTSMLKAFSIADDVLCKAVKGISELITVTGLVNPDFADLQTIMSQRGMALMGAGLGTGDDRAVEAAQHAISNPLLEDSSIEGARGVLINITGGSDMSLHEVDKAATLIKECADEDAEIIFGAVVDESMGDNIRVTVIATGFKSAQDIKRADEFHHIEENLDPGKKEKIRDILSARMNKMEGGVDNRLISSEDNERLRAVKVVGGGESFPMEDDLDIPTFIRRQVD
ncbi:Cell division protein FtsZ [hydrothermal vent metagenome]|uniref:Cell division protein FtsZ n=1 Tax=hydrothermal vent metagenome TaxID=652676 RepID=A0A3B1CWN1_9ZZZZ